MKFLLIATFFFSPFWCLSQTKAGYFDYAVLEDFFADNFEKETKLEERTSIYNDSIMLIVKPLENRISDGIDMTNDELEKREKEVKEIQLKIERKRAEFLKAIAIFEEQIDSDINNSIKIYLETFCKENNIQFLAQESDLLLCEDCIDYTQSLLDYIKKKSSASDWAHV